MANLIILIIFASVLVILIQGAIGMWIAGEKGRSTTKGFLIGAIGSVFGLIFIGASKPSDKELVDEMYERKLMSKEEYEHTVEFKINK